MNVDLNNEEEQIKKFPKSFNQINFCAFMSGERLTTAEYKQNNYK